MEDKFTLFKNSLVYFDKIKPILTKRRKQFNEKTIQQELKEKHLNEGWELIRDNTNTSRIKKQKRHNVLFEDKIWVVFAKMGFDILNLDAKLAVT